VGRTCVPHNCLENVPAHGSKFGISGGAPHVEHALGRLWAQAIPHVATQDEADVVRADMELLRSQACSKVPLCQSSRRLPSPPDPSNFEGFSTRGSVWGSLPNFMHSTIHVETPHHPPKGCSAEIALPPARGSMMMMIIESILILN
jgi:hypothetical protein